MCGAIWRHCSQCWCPLFSSFCFWFVFPFFVSPSCLILWSLTCFFILYVCFYSPLKSCLRHDPPLALPSPHRHLTSVSWDRPRRQTPTVSSADRWGQFICLERLSALLRSWPSISWVQDTRLEERKNKLLCKWCLMVIEITISKLGPPFSFHG